MIWKPCAAVLLLAGPLVAAPFTPEQLTFFETAVRPVLAEHCYGCHSAKKQTNGLRLDSREFVLRGSDYGPVVVAGNVEGSKLIHAIRQDGGMAAEAMPKEGGKLPQAAIDALTQWVQQGLPWPEEAPPALVRTVPSGKDHWAFQPIVEPPVPAVAHADLVYQPLDAFVLAKLEEKSLSLSAKVARATRLRRAQVAVVGFPPSYEKVAAFVNDPAPNAYIRQVDELLASPHFGERWARYWLDIARYADTKGYVFQEERRYPFAYTYRDWVIRAFNADMPFDEFLRQQLAADLIDQPQHPENLAALGFLTLGRRFLNAEPDIIDDRLDVIFRGTQALTIGCARCHDHKFDPIPTADYYSLYGVLASCQEPKDLPALPGVERTPEVEKFEADLAAKEAALPNYRQERLAESGKAESVEKYFLAVAETSGQKDEEVKKLAKERALYFNVLQRWRTLLEQGSAEIFGLWRGVSGAADAEFPAKFQAAMSVPNQAPVLLQALPTPPPANRQALAKLYARLLVETPDWQALLHRPDGPLSVKPDELEPFFTRKEREHLNELRQQVDNFKATSPAAPPRAMVLQDKPQPVEPYVFVRGNQGRHGESVPRQFLKVLSGPERKPFAKGSGRLELAQQITSAANPLTARVFVNRVWTHLMGTSLVDTPSDFGVRTAPPANAALLEHLAASFMAHHWSVKQLLREILLSATYQQSSLLRPEAAAVDPDNRLCWRMNPQRMDFEALRDSLLVVAGHADLTMFGKPVELFTAPYPTRRSIYGFIDRQNLPGTFRTFDFASPDTHAPKRFETTGPQQALFLLNNPFVQTAAEQLLARVADQAAPADKVRALLRRVFSREAAPAEISAAVEFISHPASTGQTNSAWSYGYGSWDAFQGRGTFTPYPSFTKGSWGGLDKLPDPALGYSHLTSEGGHPGDMGLAAIRRWTAPEAGKLRLTGVVELPAATSHGICARIISSRSGLLGEWKIPGGGKVPATVPEVSVAAGETLDFLLDCDGDTNSDGFRWVPHVATLPAGTGLADAKADFLGPAPKLDPWREFAQALLCANEFIFVD